SHEKMVAEIAKRQLPEVTISISSDVAPVIGEYERTVTTLLNSALEPTVGRAIRRLSQELQSKGIKTELLIMQSTGGVIPAADVASKAVALLNSGPVGGVIGSKFLGQTLGLENLICFDMGGTSLDVSLITEGQYSTKLLSQIYDYYNICAATPDIHTIGAGGGSIAWVEEGKRLKVGPRSAGANPGPACYGKGGEEPTVTDANVVLGHINPDRFLGGELPLYREKALSSISERAAKPLGFEPVTAASGICDIVHANMADAIRLITIAKGYDPKDYVLLAFGGAGPTHAAFVARELGIGTIVVPGVATALSAFGIALCDILHCLVFSDVTKLDQVEKINAHFEQLEEEGRNLLLKGGTTSDDIEILRYAEMRYRGQSHEVTIPIASAKIDQPALQEVMHAFDQTYEKVYGKGTAFPEVGYEIVTFRVDAIGKIPKPLLREYEEGDTDSSGAMVGKRKVLLDSKSDFVETAIFDGQKLQMGNLISGPAVVEYSGTTAIILPGQVAEVDSYLNLIIRESEK
ncbi:hydantoinase/oxoprolinase family protein, partial [Thermodesulfobacteriota bacterium]